MTTIERLHQWIAWWAGSGKLDDKPPARPEDISPIHDEEIKQIAFRVRSVQSARRGR